MLTPRRKKSPAKKKSQAKKSPAKKKPETVTLVKPETGKGYQFRILKPGETVSKHYPYEFLLKKIGDMPVKKIGDGHDGIVYAGMDKDKQIAIKVPKFADLVFFAEHELIKALEKRDMKKADTIKPRLDMLRNKLINELKEWVELHNLFKTIGINTLTEYRFRADFFVPRIEMNFQRVREIHKNGMLKYANKAVVSETHPKTGKKVKTETREKSTRLINQVAKEMARMHKVGIVFTYPDCWAIRKNPRTKQLEAIIMDFGNFREIIDHSKENKHKLRQDNLHTFLRNLAGNEERELFEKTYSKEFNTRMRQSK